MIGALESNRQALVFGHALPMPIVVRPPELTETYAPGASLRTRLGAPANGHAAVTPRGLFG